MSVPLEEIKEKIPLKSENWYYQVIMIRKGIMGVGKFLYPRFM